MTFAQDCNLCAGGTYLALDGDRVCINCGRSLGPPVHARAGFSQVTWCGLPAVHVARAVDLEDITCARCRAGQERRFLGLLVREVV